MPFQSECISYTQPKEGAELEQVLEEWLSHRLSERLPIPEIDGIDLTAQQEVA